MADEIIRLDYSAEDIGDNIDEVREARGTYDTLDDRLDNIEGGGPSPSNPIASNCVSPMTGYSKSSSSTPGNISTDDTLNAAIGKLEKRTELNENNISYNTNQGVKNLFNNVATASSGNRVSYTPNADKSGTITTESTGAAAPVYFDLGSVTLPSGTYKLSGGVSADVSLRDTNNTYVDEGNGATITLSQSATISLRIRVAAGYTNTTGVTVYPMIRNAIISDTTYQPYAMTNAEITAWILAHS